MSSYRRDVRERVGSVVDVLLVHPSLFLSRVPSSFCFAERENTHRERIPLALIIITI